MRPWTAAPGEAWRLGEGPYAFAGAPPILTGEVELVNESDGKVKVRRLQTSAADDEEAAAPGLGELRLAASLAAGARARVPAHFLVPPGTPAGRHEVELRAGDATATALVHVLERSAVELSPGVLELWGAPGDELERAVLVRNRGNVTHAVADAAMLFLHEDDWVSRSLVFALREDAEDAEDAENGEGGETGEDGDHGRYLDRVVGELRRSLVPPVQVSFASGSSEVGPGEHAVVEVSLPLPDGLRKGRTYVGTAALAGGELAFEVTCDGSRVSTERRSR